MRRVLRNRRYMRSLREGYTYSYPEYPRWESVVVKYSQEGNYHYKISKPIHECSLKDIPEGRLTFIYFERNKGLNNFIKMIYKKCSDDDVWTGWGLKRIVRNYSNSFAYHIELMEAFGELLERDDTVDDIIDKIHKVAEDHYYQSHQR